MLPSYASISLEQPVWACCMAVHMRSAYSAASRTHNLHETNNPDYVYLRTVNCHYNQTTVYMGGCSRHGRRSTFSLVVHSK
ncbi:hypothetical protein BGX38DRAFT_1161819 [Terfezia claveryi]|nr:hypothetical protein BGX38DRAFT_1161819 [Terfezia claveryi]